MAKRSQLPLFVGFSVAGALFVGVFLLLQFCDPLWDWLTQKPTLGIAISPDQIDAFTEQLRQNYCEKWRKQVHELTDISEELAAMRRKKLDAMTASNGDGYRAEFVELCRDKHEQVDGLDPDDPDLSVADMFEAAKAAERELMNHYHDINAATIAINQPQLAPIDAIGLVRVVHPQRINLNRDALLARIRSKYDGKLAAFKNQIKSGISELKAMVKHGEHILAKAKQAEKKDQAGGVNMMTAIGGGSTRGETLLPDQLNIDSGGTTEGGFRPVPGRVLGDPDRGRVNRNMYLDRWWVIGPFENRFNSNIDSSFTPESVIDLDSKTKGKGGKVIGWEYWRSNRPKINEQGQEEYSPRIEPDWAENGIVFYSWTEVWIEEAGEYWIATGSDDFGKLWVNGELKWESGKENKAYKADEYVAPMHFERGLNEILFRCTNAGGTMGWSVIFAVEQAEQ